MHQNPPKPAPKDKNPKFEVELKEASEKLVEKAGHYDPTLDLGSYKILGIDLLLEYSTGKISVTKEELHQRQDCRDPYQLYLNFLSISYDILWLRFMKSFLKWKVKDF